jgi:hypothetical protein
MTQRRITSEFILIETNVVYAILNFHRWTHDRKLLLEMLQDWPYALLFQLLTFAGFLEAYLTQSRLVAYTSFSQSLNDVLNRAGWNGKEAVVEIKPPPSGFFYLGSDECNFQVSDALLQMLLETNGLQAMRDEYFRNMKDCDAGFFPEETRVRMTIAQFYQDIRDRYRAIAHDLRWAATYAIPFHATFIAAYFALCTTLQRLGLGRNASSLSIDLLAEKSSLEVGLTGVSPAISVLTWSMPSLSQAILAACTQWSDIPRIAREMRACRSVQALREFFRSVDSDEALHGLSTAVSELRLLTEDIKSEIGTHVDDIHWSILAAPCYQSSELSGLAGRRRHHALFLVSPADMCRSIASLGTQLEALLRTSQYGLASKLKNFAALSM